MGNLIGISGKKRSGKDTVGNIINYLIVKNELSQIQMNICPFDDFSINHFTGYNTFKIKKFADKLKDIVCLLINCTREQLEDEVFKNTELGQEWWYYKIPNPAFGGLVNFLDNSLTNEDKKICDSRYLIKLTPRLLLQLLGTECGRDIIHPNIWLNSLFSEYIDKSEKRTCPETGMPILATWEEKYPNWIITDVRFPNEADIIKEKGGLLIRIESPRCNYDDTHSSETALDNYGGIGNEVRTDKWDSVIFNDGTIEELIEKVKKVLIKHKIINNV